MASPPDSEVILIPKKLRAEWMDVMALDANLSPIAYKVAGVIGRHFNSRTGKTFPKLATIARILGKSERTVWAAIQELETRGYLLVERRDLGRRASDGRRVCGGKGVANEYRPAFQRSQLVATSSGEKLAAHCDLLIGQSSQNRVPKLATGCHPTLIPSGYTLAGSPHEVALTQLASRIGPRDWRLCSEGLEIDPGPPPALILQRRFQRNILLTTHSQLVHDLLPGFELRVKGQAA